MKILNIDRLEKEIERLKDKISSYQTRLKDLERRKLETENAQFIGIAREMFTSPKELAALIELYKAHDQPVEGQDEENTAQPTQREDDVLED